MSYQFILLLITLMFGEA